MIDQMRAARLAVQNVEQEVAELRRRRDILNAFAADRDPAHAAEQTRELSQSAQIAAPLRLSKKWSGLSKKYSKES